MSSTVPSSSVAEVLPVLRAELGKLRVPSAQDKVYKDECVYSFDSPFCETGLYVNLSTLCGVGRDYLSLDAKKTNNKLYLHELWTQTKKTTSQEEDKHTDEEEGKEEKSEPSKLAIGVPGGFLGEPRYEVEKRHALVVFDGDSVRASLSLPCPELPEFLSNVLQAVIDHQGMKSALAVSTWDADNEKVVSKYAEGLEQVNPQGIRISQNPRDWKDAASDATDNLWLNLSTGYIGGGRKNWDGTGGSGSALQHYIDTGRKYPLVVKLGTITPHGADVWSYAEDEDMLVIDPLLAEHLSFWGIDIMKLEKTDKSLSEMEVSLNMTYDWSKIMEGQDSLVPVHGAHFVGLRNIGSSCYMNAMLQALFAIPEVQERYLVLRDSITQQSSDPTTDLMAQLSKVAQALLTDRYVPPEDERAEEKKPEKTSLGEIAGDVETLEKYVIAPRMLKAIVGKNHADFSSGRQQDVYEYYCHLLECIQRAEHVNLSKILPEHLQSLSSAAKPTTSIFEFQQEIKFKALDSPEVKFTPLGPGTLANIVSLQIPLDKAEKVTVSEEKEREREDESKQESKRARVEDEQKSSLAAEEQLRVPFEACLESTFSPDTVSLRHPVNGAPTTFSQTTRFASFPRYLVLKLNRYYVGENWTPKKISAEVPMPEKMDLSQYKAEGLLPGEIELQESNATANAEAGAPFVVDESLVEQLVMMGFSENGCRRAAIATRNADPETAMNWILEHMEDADFNDPPALPDSAASSALPAVDEEQIMLLSSMGFTAEQAKAALIATNNNVERAADWLFSRADTLDADVADVLNQKSSASPSTSAAHVLEQGEGKYTLMAIISHIGKNTEHGHYVVHIRKQNEWFLFNDEKVGKSEKPPLGFGYMYIYRRDDSPGTMFI